MPDNISHDCALIDIGKAAIEGKSKGKSEGTVERNKILVDIVRSAWTAAVNNEAQSAVKGMGEVHVESAVKGKVVVEGVVEGAIEGVWECADKEESSNSLSGGFVLTC